GVPAGGRGSAGGGGGTVRRRGEEPDRDFRRRSPCGPRAASALGVNDIDAFGADETLDGPDVAPQRERIGAVGGKRNPFAAVGLEFADERPIAPGDQRPAARLQQREGDV